MPDLYVQFRISFCKVYNLRLALRISYALSSKIHHLYSSGLDAFSDVAELFLFEGNDPWPPPLTANVCLSQFLSSVSELMRSTATSAISGLRYHNPRVGGSSPSSATSDIRDLADRHQL